MVRCLNIVKPAIPYLPEVAVPERRIPFKEKLMWTSICLFIFLTCCQIPIYGVHVTGTDAFYWVRMLMASNRGTLMELGISPLILANTVVSLLAGSNCIDVDQTLKEDRMLFQGAQKLMAIIWCFGTAFAYVLSGYYGTVGSLGVSLSLLIVAQLTVAGIIVMLLDELLSKGWGLGGGVTLFIATEICEAIVWKTFSPNTIISTGKGTEFEGALLAFFHLCWSRTDKMQALKEALYRQSAPNLTNLFATGLIFFIVIYFQGFRVDLHVRNQKFRGNQGVYPIKLFYASSLPVIIMQQGISQIYFVSQVLYRRWKSNMIVNLLGQWQDMEYGGQSVPVGGLAYYISPPNGFSDLFTDPLHTFTYMTFVMGTCSLISKFWIEVMGDGPRDCAKRLRDQGMIFKGYRETSILQVLNMYIPVAASFGGVCIGMLTIVADFLGAIGTGTGILLAVNLIYQYFEIIHKEKDQGNLLF